MSSDAYAGFLRMLLMPVTQVPPMTPDVEAYLQHANKREPLPEALRQLIGPNTSKAA